MKIKNKRDAFDILWVKYDYCMMGYPKDALYRSMSKKEVLHRLKRQEEESWLDERMH